MDLGNEPNLWSKHQKQWHALGPPLRPAAEDLALFNREIGEWSKTNSARVCAFVLGVTPEFPSLSWPEGSSVYALDRSLSMIKTIWPSQAGHCAGAVAMDWLGVPLVDESADIILGDGCFSLIDWPADYKRMLASLLRLLKPNGRLIMRFFLRPQISETPEKVFTDLAKGRIGNFHIFRWRLAMAMHGDNPAGIQVNDIWNLWNDSGLSAEEVALEHGWPLESVQTIQAYDSSRQRLSFPTLNELMPVLEENFAGIRIFFPHYELGDRCPILSMGKD